MAPWVPLSQQVRAIQKELDALRSQLMKMEVAQMNELEKQRLRAQADAEMVAARRQVEGETSNLDRELARARAELQALQGDLSRCREAKGAAEARLDKERDANATWQARRDEQLNALRSKLIKRTEQMLQIGLNLDSAIHAPVRAAVGSSGGASCETTAAAAAAAVDAGEGKAAADDGTPTVEAQLSLVMTIANELREERDAHRCCVCMVTERSALLLPCKHAVLCQPCAATVRGSSGRCPLCRMGIEDVIQIFS